jgi:hypothetical protein
MANDQWYFSKGDDHQQGPVSAQELNRMAQSGKLRPDDLVWKEGMGEWVSASRIKQLTFSVPSPVPTTSPSPTRFDAETLQSTFRDAQRKADEAAGVLWFLDLKFNKFVTSTIIRVVWSLYLAFAVLSLIFGFIGGILNYPILEAIMWWGLSLIFYTFMTLMLRMFLEGFMVIFRMAEHLREMNEKLA